MKEITKKTIFIALLFIMITSLGRLTVAETFWLSFKVGLINPQGEFKNNMGNKSYVVPTISFAYKPYRSPLAVGLSFEYVSFGTDKRVQEVYIPEFNQIGLDIVTGHTMIRGLLMLKLLPLRRGKVLPYLEGFLGYNFFKSSVYIPGGYDDATETEETLASRTLSKDTAFYYGAGAGILYKVATSKIKSKRGLRLQHFIDFGFHYSHGNTAEYMKKGSTTIEDGTAYFSRFESEINTLKFSIGYTISIP